jgi:hypothetical protein
VRAPQYLGVDAAHRAGATEARGQRNGGRTLSRTLPVGEAFIARLRIF